MAKQRQCRERQWNSWLDKEVSGGCHPKTKLTIHGGAQYGTWRIVGLDVRALRFKHMVTLKIPFKLLHAWPEVEKEEQSRSSTAGNGSETIARDHHLSNFKTPLPCPKPLVP